MEIYGVIYAMLSVRINKGMFLVMVEGVGLSTEKRGYLVIYYVI